MLQVLRGLPSDLPVTIGVALHRSPEFASQLAALLSRCVALPVSEPNDGEPLESGHVYLAPRDIHMTIEDEYWRLARGAKVHRVSTASKV